MNIFFLGCGKMGSILAKKIAEKKSPKSSKTKVPTNLVIFKKTENNKISGLNYVKKISDLSAKKYKADIVFIAVKPQDSKEILSQFASENIFHKNTIFISILAGKKIEFFEKIFAKKLGFNPKIIRAMPNLPAEYSQGIFAYSQNKEVTKSEVKELEKIFTKFGLVLNLKDEKLFDAATAIFGCGPAYIFHLQEIFLEIAISSGFSKDKASELIKKLFLGSSLMSEKSEENFSDLKNSVTSKKGATHAALEILSKSDLKKILRKSVDAAITRSKELSKD